MPPAAPKPPSRLRRLLRRRIVWLAVILAAMGGLLGWGSCTMFHMPGRSHSGPLPALSPAQTGLAAELRQHVDALAVRIGERNSQNAPALADAAGYLTQQWQVIGLPVRRQEYTARGGTYANLEAELPGLARPVQIVVVGAHYDSVVGSPGANDNASGVAALLALARRFAGRPQPRTLRFVGFVNEEPPFFQTPDMGSMAYARACRDRGDPIVAAIVFDGLGCYSDQPGSQQYPPPFGLLFPSTANFIGFQGDLASADAVKRAIAVFRRHAQFPSQGAAIPQAIGAGGLSDHWSFWQHGYPALLVTDTLPFRYAHYHTERDTPDKIDFERMARVVEGLEAVVGDLAAGR